METFVLLVTRRKTLVMKCCGHYTANNDLSDFNQAWLELPRLEWLTLPIFNKIYNNEIKNILNEAILVFFVLITNLF